LLDVEEREIPMSPPAHSSIFSFKIIGKQPLFSDNLFLKEKTVLYNE
jgi:hypothetical protein